MIIYHITEWILLIEILQFNNTHGLDVNNDNRTPEKAQIILITIDLIFVAITPQKMETDAKPLHHSCLLGLLVSKLFHHQG